MSQNAQRTLRVLEILKGTDAEHSLTANQIAEKLENLWGIESTDKVIRRDIHALQDCGYAVELNADSKKGWYLEGDFEDWELKVLMDAAQSAKFLDQKSTDGITAKLRGLASDDARKHLGRMTIPAESKRGDRTTKIAVDAVMRAIRAQKKLRFDYVHTDESRKTVSKHPGGTKPVSPYALIWRKDRYYLIGCYDGVTLSYYRLDRIRSIALTDEPAIPLRELLGDNAEQKLREFVKKNVYNKKGREVRVELALRRNGVDSVMDSFGEDVRIITNPDGTLSAFASVSDSEGLYTWLMHHSGECTVIGPETVREEMRRRLKATLEEYEY